MATVLVVDDTSEVRMLLTATLRQAGYKVLEAADGGTVMERTLEAQPDAIILDIMMPGVDGWEALRRLKTHQRTKDIPVIISSALKSDEDLSKAGDLGAFDFVPKPWSATELLNRLRWAVSQSAA